MLELSRNVRFCLTGDSRELASARDNTFAAWPAMRGLGRYYELDVTCVGEADPQTGYFINIKAIDEVVRDHALPMLAERIADEVAAAATPMGVVMRELFTAIDPPLNNTVARIRLALTPTLSFAIERDDMDHVVIRQQYEFSAAHRLHVPSLSDDENRATFGKCNNPAGHGHNYRVEVAARCPIDAHGCTLEPADLDAVINREAIDQLDHKHLNEDVPEFENLNPSVEHIVKVVWQMLDGKLPGGATLDEVKVWETGKTVCAYRGEGG
jgi:6-pyruvoyltetrahydropterin/6-carboxytetrahydropterin synthase